MLTKNSKVLRLYYVYTIYVYLRIYYPNSAVPKEQVGVRFRKMSSIILLSQKASKVFKIVPQYFVGFVL